MNADEPDRACRSGGGELFDDAAKAECGLESKLGVDADCPSGDGGGK